MELNEELVKLGRALGQLPLKESQLEDTVRDSGRDLAEHYSVFNGILDGLLIKGEWEDAVFYSHVSPGPRFVADPEETDKKILEAAKQRQSRYVHEKTVNALNKSRQYELIFDLLSSLPISADNTANLFNIVEEHLPPQQKKKFQTLLGKRILEKQHIGSEDLSSAIHHLKQAEDTEQLSALYDKLLAEDPSRHWNKLITIARSDAATQKERLTQLVQKNIEAYLDPESKDTTQAEHIYRLIIKEELDIPPEQQDYFKRETLKRWHTSSVKEYAPDLLDEWAALRGSEQSFAKECYIILRKAEGFDEERLAALKAGLEFSGGHEEAKKKAIQPYWAAKEDLAAVYDRLNPHAKYAVAFELNDHQKMKDLARDFEQQGELTNAYRLWVRANGALDDEFAVNLRQKIFTERPDKVTFYFLDLSDEQGFREAYDLAAAQGLQETAYEIAWVSKSNDLLSQARKGFLDHDPQAALKKFMKVQIGKEDKDPVGIDQALDVLAQRYEVPKEQLLPYFAAPEAVQQ